MARATVEFRSTALDEVVEWLRKEHGLTVVVRKAELEKEGNFGDEIMVTDSLQEAPLYFLLDRLGLLGIGWYVEDGTIYLTARKIVDERTYTAPYHLGELLDEKYQADEIESLIEGAIAPESWDFEGGNGRLNLVGDVLFIRNTGSIHRKVQGLLAALKQHGRQTFVDTPSVNVELRSRLSEPVSFRFQATPLNEVVRELARLSNADIRLDQTGLRTEGVRERHPVTLQVEDLPLERVLDHLLKELGLTWTIRDGVLWITDEDRARAQHIAGVYDVRDLCANDDESYALSDAVTSQMPDIWSGDGGASVLRFAKPGTVVVWASLGTHTELLDLLEKYRFALRTSRIRQADPEADPEKTLYYRLDANMAGSLVSEIQLLVEPDSWTSSGKESAVGTIRILESRTEIQVFKSDGQTVQVAVAKKVLAIHQRQSVHTKITKLISRIEDGDSETRNLPGGMGGMGGGMGGFGGGYFSVEPKQ